MTTSGYMPDVVVEIAFNAGWSTPAASRTWTDVSTYLELDREIVIGFGRADELSTPDANTLTLVLDNTTGRFTPEKTSGAYYPNVKIGRPIRVTSTRVGGAASTRFLGYINDWAPSSEGTNPTTTITASSSLARLGLESQFYSTLAGSFASLDSLYKLNEAAAPLVDSAGDVADLTAFGTYTLLGGDGPDGDGTAIRFTGSGSVESIDGYLPGDALGDDVVLEAFFKVSTTADEGILCTLLTSGGYIEISLTSSGGTATASATNALDGASVNASEVFANDGELHHVAIHANQTTTSFYLDGAEWDSAPSGAFSGSAFYLQAVAGITTGTADLSYLAISDDYAGIAERALVGLANLDQPASTRIGAYAAHASIESTDIDTTTELLTPYPLYEKTMLEAMQAAAVSDGGVLYDSAAGALTYNDRESRYTAASAFTLSASSHQIDATIAPKYDRFGLVNEATVTQTGGATYARRSDGSSIDDYGPARTAIEIQGEYDACLQAAAWLVFIGNEPATRIPTLDVDLLPLSGGLQDALLAATVGTRFTVTGLPTEFAASSLEFFVEGYVETIGPESYGFSLNVSPRPTAKWDVWTVEDATYGAYDSNPIAW